MPFITKASNYIVLQRTYKYVTIYLLQSSKSAIRGKVVLLVLLPRVLTYSLLVDDSIISEKTVCTVRPTLRKHVGR